MFPKHEYKCCKLKISNIKIDFSDSYMIFNNDPYFLCIRKNSKWIFFFQCFLFLLDDLLLRPIQNKFI